MLNIVTLLQQLLSFDMHLSCMILMIKAVIMSDCKEKESARSFHREEQREKNTCRLKWFLNRMKCVGTLSCTLCWYECCMWPQVAQSHMWCFATAHAESSPVTQGNHWMCACVWEYACTWPAQKWLITVAVKDYYLHICACCTNWLKILFAY